jgi:hypothetical protein
VRAQEYFKTSISYKQLKALRSPICFGYQNIPVNLDEAQRQIGILSSGVQQYSIMSAQRSRNPTIINFRFTGVQRSKRSDLVVGGGAVRLLKE